jgi:hypothetical protein
MHLDTLSYPRLTALGLVSFLVIAIVLNVLWQLVNLVLFPFDVFSSFL